MGGSGGGHKSGGGGSGAQSWPKYMHRSHWAMLIGATQTGDEPEKGLWSTRVSDYASEPGYVSVMRDTAETHDNSPFEGHFSYDPDTRLSNMNTDWTNHSNIVKALDDDTDFNRILDNVKTKVDALVDESTIQPLIDEFDADQTKALMTSIGRYSAGFADIGGHNSSAYIIGLALLEDEHLRQVRKFDKTLRIDAYKDKMKLYEQFSKLETSIFFNQQEQMKQSVGQKLELERMGLIAEKEQLDRDVELSIRDAQWELEVWQYGSNILAGISGAVGSPTHGIGKEADGGSKLMGALGGAASGAAAGGVFGAPGAIVGGIVGLLGGL
tara:strand:+ start:3013 stop:3990 length:978 start_codon:yes stop_codon:yes gene_type:complete